MIGACAPIAPPNTAPEVPLELSTYRTIKPEDNTESKTASEPSAKQTNETKYQRSWPDGTLNLSYHLYAGGFHAMTLNSRYEVNDNNYSTEISIEPHGWIGKLIQWNGQYRADGIIQDKNDLRPITFTRSNAWGDEIKQTRLRYNKNGDLLISKHVKLVDGEMINSYPHDIDKARADDTIDISSAIFNAIRHLERTGSCDEKSTVFDGNRIYNYITTEKGNVTIKASRYNIFSGSALACTIKIEPVHGFNEGDPAGFYRLQEMGKKKGKLPQTWYGDHPEIPFKIPVRMTFHSDFGTVLAHLKSAEFRQ